MQAGRSIRAPLGRLLAAVGMAAVGTTVWWAGNAAGERAAADLGVRLASRGGAASDQLQRQLRELRQDALFLSRVPPVPGIVRARQAAGFDHQEKTPLTLWESRLTDIYGAYMAGRPEIVQIRLIGMADQGREILRIDRLGGRPVRTPAAQLQQKGETDYLRATALLPAGATYLSDFNLNREHGRVEMPHWATVRAATPVHDADGKVFGAVVVNYRAEWLLAPLAANLPPDLFAYLHDGGGAFLLHPDQARTYGSDTGKPWRWQDEFRPAGARYRAAGLQAVADAAGRRFLFMERTIVLDASRPGSELHYWMGAPEARVAAAVTDTRTTVLGAMLAGAVLVGAASSFYRAQRRRIHKHQSHLSAIVEHSRDAIIGVTADGVITSWNAGASAMFGYAAHDALGHALTSLIVPAQRVDDAKANLRRVAAGEAVIEQATTCMARDGSEREVTITSSPIRDHEGNVTGIAKIIRDVSEQAAANRHIQELNVSLEAQVAQRTAQIEAVMMLQRAILAHASHAIIATGPQGAIQLFNPAAERMLGYKAEDMVGKQTPAILHDAEEVAARARVLSAELGEVVEPGFEAFVAKARRCIADQNEWTYIRRDGSRFPVLLSVSALRSENGAINGYLGIAQDISAAQRDRRNLEAARDQLLDAAEVAELGIFSWTLDSGQIEWNQRMYALYGIASEEAAGGLTFEHWRSRVHPDDVDRVITQLQRAIDGEGRYDPVFRAIRRDGAIRHVQAAASVERDGKGKPVRVLGINRDITAQFEVEDQLRLAKQAADDASRAKSGFLANMSHEIRTPMNAVLGMLALLKQTTLAPRQFEYADKAEHAGRALLGIINDILDFSRVEAGKLALDPQPFSLDQMLREVGVILSANLAGKPIEILYDVAADLPDQLVGDAMRLQQILINIAGNAIKFTDGGEVALAVRRLPPKEGDGGNAVRLEFVVRDTGIGIAPEKLGTIFEGFCQAETSTARRYGGSGLGLAICSRLVELMGGELSASSTPGRGSVFRFSVAVLAAPDADQASQAPQAAALRCLLVCAHPALAASLQAQAHILGWQCGVAADAAIALAQAARCPPDLVMVNCSDAGLVPDSMVRDLRASCPGSCIVLLVTAPAEVPGGADDAAHPDADRYLVKPVTVSMLREVAGQAPVMPDGGNLAGLLDGISLLLVEDNLLNQQVGSELLALAGARVTLAENGEAALEEMRQMDGKFDCVLMDVQMPGLDGYGATRILRALYGGSCPPIIAMTANAMASDRAEALAAGMIDFVSKPFDARHLAATVLRHTCRPGAAATAAPPLAESPCAGFDSAGALARFAGNAALYRRALAGFAAEAAAIERAIPMAPDAGAWGAAKTALHTLKGLAGTVGAGELAGAAHQLEYGLPLAGAEWAAQRQRLVQLLSRDAAFAAALAAQLQRQADVVPGGDGGRLQPELLALQSLLRQSNMAAIARYDLLLQQFGARLGEIAVPLGVALEQCDFPQALRECELLIQRMEPA